jgi:hypothetical protein
VDLRRGYRPDDQRFWRNAAQAERERSNAAHAERKRSNASGFR